MNEKSDLGLKVPKKGTLKKEKMGKCPKTDNFGHVWCILLTKSFLPGFCRAVKLYLVHFSKIRMQEAEMSCNSVQSDFCVRNVDIS